MNARPAFAMLAYAVAVGAILAAALLATACLLTPHHEPKFKPLPRITWESIR